MTAIVATVPIPRLNASLHVSDLRSAVFWGRRRWALVITMRGPDARYNMARGEFSPKQVRALGQALAQALEIMERSPVGDQDARHVDAIAPGIFVERSRGTALLRIQLSSGTRVFARHLTRDEVRTTLAVLTTLPERARQIAGAS